MFRICLIGYLIFVTSAGPSFCCCKIARLLADITRLNQNPHSMALPSCCCHGGKAMQESDVESKARRPARPYNDECPCQKYRSQLFVLAECDAEQLELQSLKCIAVCELVCPPSTGIARALADKTNSPCLAAKNPLKTLPILRC